MLFSLSLFNERMNDTFTDYGVEAESQDAGDSIFILF